MVTAGAGIELATTTPQAAITAADEAVGDQGATQNTGWGADSEAHFDEIRTKLNANATAINSIITALEVAGIVTPN